MDAEYSASALSDGFMNPRPPIRTDNATRSRSASEQLRPMSDGISTSEIARSKGCSRCNNNYIIIIIIIIVIINKIENHIYLFV